MNFISYEWFESFEEGQEKENIQTKNSGTVSYENKKGLCVYFPSLYFWLYKIFLSHFSYDFMST